MIRKLIIVVLASGALATVVIELCSRASRCSIRLPCPVRMHLGQWSRGYHRYIYAVSHSLYSTVGYVCLGPSRVRKENDEAEGWFHAICAGPMHATRRRLVNFVRIDDVFPSQVFQRALVLPRGSFFLAFAAYPGVAFITGPVRRWRRKRKGLCLNCGYDLSGNVSGVCPECGNVIKA